MSLTEKSIMLAVFIMGLSACLLTTGALASSVTLQVLVHGNDDYLRRSATFFEGFEAENPGIEIEILPSSSGSPQERLAVLVAGGVSPDVARLWGVPEVARAGLIQDITERFERLPASVRNDFWPILIRGTLSWNGRLYALPLGAAVSTFFYNVRQFEEAGVGYPSDNWRWEREGTRELQRLTRDLNGDGVPEMYGLLGVGGGSGRETYHFGYAAGGGPLFSPDGTKFLGNSDAVRAALQFLQDLGHVHRVMAPKSGNYSEFGTQKTATMLWGSFMFGYMKAYPDLEWNIAVTPSFAGRRATNVWPETPYSIPVGCKHPEEAWRVLEFIASTEGQTLAMELGWGIPPARRSVALSAFINAYRGADIPAMIQMIEEPLTEVLPEHVPGEIRTVYYNQVITPVVYSGIKSPAIALDEATPVIQAMLDDWNRQ
ncbi:MAG: ABC transporter substrate-binding protein [Limnochordia bacterium]